MGARLRGGAEAGVGGGGDGFDMGYGRLERELWREAVSYHLFSGVCWLGVYQVFSLILGYM